ncbi:MAG: hypothetical protein ACFFHD_04690 [Promethearchaeota archaeon]
MALIAKDKEVKQLILTHFNASIFKTKENRIMALNKTKQIFKSSILAHDEYKLSI